MKLMVNKVQISRNSNRNEFKGEYFKANYHVLASGFNTERVRKIINFSLSVHTYGIKDKDGPTTVIQTGDHGKYFVRKLLHFTSIFIW